MTKKTVQELIDAVNILLPVVVGTITLVFTNDIVKAVALATITKTIVLSDDVDKLKKKLKALEEAATSTRAE